MIYLFVVIFTRALHKIPEEAICFTNGLTTMTNQKRLKYFAFAVLLLTMAACFKESLPPLPDEPDVFEACVISGTPATFDLVTFNVQGFPKNGYTSTAAFVSLIKAMEPDVVALQEVTTEADFNRMLNLLPGYTGKFYLTDNDLWNLAFIVKNSETDIIASTEKLLFENDSRAFPRPPFEISVKHKTLNLEVTLINLHLKCCGGDDNEKRRREASVKLKDYLDREKPIDNVVVLGDFNDEISSPHASENPFLNFIGDTQNYFFADMAIAAGSALWWSYPDMPSHIDHILVTNELAPLIDTTYVLKVSPCYPEYNRNISDHRPVGIRFAKTR